MTLSAALTATRGSVRGVLAVPGAVVATAGFCVLTLAVFDVSVSQAALYLGYQLGFVVLPGLVVFLAVTGRRTIGISEFAVAIGLGYALEVGAFALAGATGQPSLFCYYPLAVALPSLRFVQVEADARAWLRSAPRLRTWFVSLAIVLLVGILAGAILDTPLPSQVYALRGYGFLWPVAVTAEAVQHWPLTVPNFVGEPLDYHIFSFLDMAGAVRVTGLGAWLVNFRLFPVWAAVVLAVEVYAAGRAYGRTAAAGLGALFLFFFASRFAPWRQLSSDIVDDLYLSNTFAFGLLVFFPLLIVLRGVFVGGFPWRRGSLWVVTAALAFVCSGAKAPILLVVAGGLSLMIALELVRGRREALLRLIAADLLLLGAFAISYVLLYKRATDRVSLDPLYAVKDLQPFQLVSEYLPSLAHPLVWIIAAALLTLKYVAVQVPPIAIAVTSRAWRRDVYLLLAIAISGFAVIFVFRHPGNSELYFALYGYGASALAGGAGIALIAREWRPPPRMCWTLAVAVPLLLLVLWPIDAPGRAKPVWLNIDHTRSRSGEYAGLRWIAEHASPDAVLAVDPRPWLRNCFQSAFTERRTLIDCFVGFTPEQDAHTVHEALADVRPALRDEARRRMALVERIFDRGDPRALDQAAASYGVRYVVVDLAGSGTPAQVERLQAQLSVVFRNKSVVVFRVPQSAQASGA